MKPLNLKDNAPWKARYRASRIAWLTAAKSAPNQVLFCSNQSGKLQLYGWNVAHATQSQLTFRENGQLTGSISANGRFVYYLDDAAGNELGHFVRVPFAGGAPENVTPDLPLYASWGWRENATGERAGFVAANADGFTFYVMAQDENGRLSTPRAIWQTPALSGTPAFSTDGQTAVITTSEKNRSLDNNLVAVDTETGDVVAELFEPNVSLDGAMFSPIAGDSRFLATTNGSGYKRPFIWNVANNEVEPLRLPDLAGEVFGWDWSENGRYLLLCQLNQAQFQLFIYDLETHTLKRLEHPSGSLFGASFRPNGDIFTIWQGATQPTSLLVLDGQTGAIKETLLGDATVPTGHPWRSVTFPSSQGAEIQAWVATPEGEGPFPMILHTHGGPTSVMTETFNPEAQAWLDHGFAFMSVNYRGSTTFGKAFEKAIWGNLGDVEVDDMAAARDWAVENGIAMSDSILLTGGSYGGYLTLQGLGRRPDLWAGGMAGVAIADWKLMYEDQAETLRGYQRALFGGAPDEKPEAHAKSSPITYAADLKAPIMVIQGSNDTRCPARQMRVYEDKLTKLGKEIQVHWFDAGHGSYQNEQLIEHQELKLRFAYRVLG
ncbi:MAG: prolyl oligopeptidase family serine peptidase [Chloroflexota bacterium]